MRRIGVVTFARSEFSSCFPLARAIHEDGELELQLIVSGAHLSHEFGLTVGEIESSGLPIAERVEMLVSSDSGEGIAKSIGLGTIGLGQAFAHLQPDVVLLVGDRYELLSAAAAALAARIPVAHVSGGDVTEGAIDNQVRYAVSALSHVHFVAHESHAQRLIAFGEEPWRVFVTGDPALDAIDLFEPLSLPELEQELGMPLARPLVLVTQHPATLGSNGVAAETDALLAALEGFSGTLVFTYPGADPESRIISDRIRAFCAREPSAAVFPSFGQRLYYGVLRHADAMVGNSSSGIWEAPSFGLPVVNVGERQRGRLRVGNVIDVGGDATAIRAALATALDPAFRQSLAGLRNPYGDGRASARIVEALRELEPGPRLSQKVFGEL